MSTPRPAPVIRCDHVCLGYGRQEVVHEVCLEIEAGAFLPFVGPNGAGKTTLLRALLGLLKPMCGRIITPFDRRPPGYLPQYKAIDPLYPVSTRQIIEMGLFPELGWWRRPSRDQQGRVDDALTRLGLMAHQHKTFGELSGGMKQKALLGRALVSGAEVFIMDEPTAALDEAAEQEVLAHLQALSRDDGKTVLFAHHGLEQAAALAPRVAVVMHGRVQVTDLDAARLILSGRSARAPGAPAS